jgi:hypothetical protein
MNNYYRITGYDPETDIGFIADSNGKFEKLWEFSAYLVSKGMKILEVGNDTKFSDGNIERIKPNAKLVLRATAKGKPDYITQSLNGTPHKAVKVNDKIYIPDITK